MLAEAALDESLLSSSSLSLSLSDGSFASSSGALETLCFEDSFTDALGSGEINV